jgi:hypothetical protein
MNWIKPEPPTEPPNCPPPPPPYQPNRDNMVLLIKDIGTSDLDVRWECVCGNYIHLYVEDYEKECEKCGKIYLCKVKVDLYIKEK